MDSNSRHSSSPPLDTTVEVVTPENIAFEYQLAGPFRRGPAFFIDLFVRYLFVAFCFFVVVFFGMFTGPLGFVFAFAGANIFFFFVDWFYGAFFETYFNGRTPGKWACGVRVVGTAGHPINGRQAVLRNLLRIADLFPAVSLQSIHEDFPPIFLIPTGLVAITVMLFTRRMQRLGDLAADTMVVVDERAWRLPVVKVEDKRVPALASYIPADFRVSQSLAKALAQYAERRAYLSPARRREVARTLSVPLIERFQFRRDIDPDLLLYALYWRTFLADERGELPELGELAKFSPLARDKDKDVTAAASATLFDDSAAEPVAAVAVDAESDPPALGQETSAIAPHDVITTATEDPRSPGPGGPQ